MQSSRAFRRFATTSGWFYYIFAFPSSSVRYAHVRSSVLPSSVSTTSSLLVTSLAMRSNTSSASPPPPPSSSAPTASINPGNNLFQLSDPLHRPPPTATATATDDTTELLLQQQPFVIVENRVVRNDLQPPNNNDDSATFTSKQFLTSFPSGAYTTSRTVGAQRVLRLRQHLDRMAESARLMVTAEPPADADADADAAVEKEEEAAPNSSSNHRFLTEGTILPTASITNGSSSPQIRTLIQQSLAAAIASFEYLHPASQSLEKRITTLLFWETPSVCDTSSAPSLRLRVLSYTELLPPPPRGRIIAQMCRTRRSNALAKNSQWVTDRKRLEQGKLLTNPPVHEVLLTSEGGGDGGTVVLEGLSSNFFAVSQSGIVYTASREEGVLLGTLRSVVLKVCEESGIEVVEAAPEVGRWREWVGAFVSSTSRLVLPVTDLILPSSASLVGGDGDGDGDGDGVDVMSFRYGDNHGMQPHNSKEEGAVVGAGGNNADDDDGGKDVRSELGLLQDQNSSRVAVGECVTAVRDSKGIMKTIVEGVNAAVLRESERPW